jgi:hypothetical protein
MEIIIEEISRPTLNSFTMFAKPNLDYLRENKILEIHVNNHTKTRLSASMTFGGDYRTKTWHLMGLKRMKKDQIILVVV